MKTSARLVPLAAAALGLVLLQASCSSTQYVEVPSWIDQPPVDETYLYATGNFAGSLNPDDNEQNALKEAYRNLAHALESKVLSRVDIRDSGGRRRGSSRSRIRSDVSVKNAEHLETWRDVDGLRGRRGGVWVLVRVRKP